MSEQKTLHRPDMKQRLKIANLLQIHKDKLISERPSFDSIGEWFTKELGFTITGDGIKGTVRLLDWKWIPKRSGAGGRATNRLWTRIKSLEAQNELLTKRTDNLRIALMNLADRCGEATPQAIRDEYWPKPSLLPEQDEE